MARATLLNARVAVRQEQGRHGEPGLAARPFAFFTCQTILAGMSAGYAKFQGRIMTYASPEHKGNRFLLGFQPVHCP